MHTYRNTHAYICAQRHACAHDRHAHTHMCMHTHTRACTHDTQACTHAQKSVLSLFITSQPAGPVRARYLPTHRRSGCKAKGRKTSPSQQLSSSQSYSGYDPQATKKSCFLPSVIKRSNLPHFPPDAGTNHGPRTSSRVFARLLCPRHLCELAASEPRKAILPGTSSPARRPCWDEDNVPRLSPR